MYVFNNEFLSPPGPKEIPCNVLILEPFHQYRIEAHTTIECTYLHHLVDKLISNFQDSRLTSVKDICMSLMIKCY